MFPITPSFPFASFFHSTVWILKLWDPPQLREIRFKAFCCSEFLKQRMNQVYRNPQPLRYELDSEADLSSCINWSLLKYTHLWHNGSNNVNSLFRGSFFVERNACSLFYWTPLSPVRTQEVQIRWSLSGCKHLVARKGTADCSCDHKKSDNDRARKKCESKSRNFTWYLLRFPANQTVRVTSATVFGLHRHLLAGASYYRFLKTTSPVGNPWFPVKRLSSLWADRAFICWKFFLES